MRFAKSASVLKACRSLGSVMRFKSAGVKTSFDLHSAAPLSSEQVSCQLSPVADPTLVVRGGREGEKYVFKHTHCIAIILVVADIT